MRNVIFDLGNVLIEWDPALAFADAFTTRDAAEAWLHEIGFHDWNRAQDGGRSFDEGIAAARAEHGDRARWLEGYLAAFPVTIENPVPGSWEILEELAAQAVPLYAITNWSKESWPAAAELHPRLSLFRDILVSGQERLLKPEAAIYLRLLERNGLTAGESIFIDDSLANVEGARAVGLDAIHFIDASQLRAELVQRGLLG